MAINEFFISCGEMASARPSGTPFSHDGVRTYQRKFLVQYSNKFFGPVEICQCPGIPLPYSPYIVNTNIGTSDLRALCVKISSEPYKVAHEGDWGKAIVSCDYSTDLKSGNTGSNFPNKQDGAQNNPELEPPEIEWSFQENNRAFTADLDGNAFVNSAGLPLTPAPSIEVAYPVLTITRNELTFDRRRATKFAYAVNKDVFLTTTPGGAQCLPPSARIAFKGSSSYWRVTYKIRFCVALPDGTLSSWQYEVNDNGLQELVFVPGVEDRGGPTEDVLVKLARGVMSHRHIKPAGGGGNISQAVLLDGYGKQLKPQLLPKTDANGQPIIGPDGNQMVTARMKPVVLKFRTYRTEDFTDLFVRGLG